MKRETGIRLGMASAVLFVAVLFIEGALRPGYDAVYHTGSALSLGDRGWIQIANFVQLGVALIIFAAALRRTLEASLGAALVAASGLGFVAAGVFTMDPMRGYPPGTPPGTPAHLSWHHQLHDASGPLAFLALLGACLVLSRHLRGRWRLYTLITAALGLALLVGTGLSWQRDAALTGLVQRGLIVVFLTWIVALGANLLRRPALQRGANR